MLNRQDIVCFANDWDSDPTSKKHIMARLAAHNRVLWVNSIGCRTPQVSARDLRRAGSKLLAFARGCRRVGDNLWTLSPLVVPFHGNRAARRLNRRLLQASLRLACRRLGFRNVINWSFVPSAAEAAGTFGERLVVYHCVDEFSRFTGVDADAIAALERQLVERADLVLVSAERLLADRRSLNPRTHLVRHGVDVEHFGRALAAETEVPADLRSLGGPILGFFGLLADWVDWELVAAMARARPRWTVALIGKPDCDLSAIAGLDNVRVLGWRSYAELPDYCKGFDVALLPFKLNELTLASNPLKLREYLAAGLPVVSTAVPEVERLQPWVRIAAGADGFIHHIDELLASGDFGPAPARAAAMVDESWDHKVEEMCALVEEQLAQRDRRDAEGVASVASRLDEVLQ